MINIKDLPKEEVLKALYDGARVQGMGAFQAKGAPAMTVDHAKELLEESTYFDYVYGRVMKVNLRHDEFNPALYDRDNGSNAAQIIIDELKEKLLNELEK